jgi:hypothetical protein
MITTLIIILIIQIRKFFLWKAKLRFWERWRLIALEIIDIELFFWRTANLWIVLLLFWWFFTKVLYYFWLIFKYLWIIFKGNGICRLRREGFELWKFEIIKLYLRIRKLFILFCDNWRLLKVMLKLLLSSRTKLIKIKRVSSLCSFLILMLAFHWLRVTDIWFVKIIKLGKIYW